MIKSDLGFQQLFYKGLPVIQKAWFPKNKVGFLNEDTGIMQVVDLKTKKVTEIDYSKYELVDSDLLKT